MPEPDHARPADDGWDRPWFSDLGRGRDDNEPGGDGWGNDGGDAGDGGSDGGGGGGGD
ncbi:hypothetical protein ABZ465_06815 [Streptomyces griseoincarnatus]